MSALVLYYMKTPLFLCVSYDVGKIVSVGDRVVGN
jgi:hypothetical protein